MTTVFAGLVVLGVALGLVAALLIWRARSAPRSPDSQAAAEGVGRFGRWLTAAITALDYASTRRAWRYRLPWVLMLGEPGSGKTSLVLSASELGQSHPDERYASLRLAGARWSVMNGGALVDIDGPMWASGTSSAQDRRVSPAVTRATAAAAASARTAVVKSEPGTASESQLQPEFGSRKDNEDKTPWAALVTKLVDLRPERPIDAVVLTVSARTLLEAGTAELDRLAAAAYCRLSDLQDAFGFVLPVSVVVTQCDVVDGFAAFWRVQPEALRTQMFGWSAPGLARDDTPAEWCDAAFDGVGDQLRALQLDAAARDRDAESPEARDGMLLFPAWLQALQGPLSHWLGAAFQTTLDRPGHLFRGIYFTGDLDGGGVEPRRGVAFVTGLIRDKLFAERGNARVVRASAWSRSRYLRAFQIGALSVAAVLAVGLAASAVELRDKVGRLDRSLAQLRSEPAYAGGVCPSAGKVSSLLLAMRELDTDSFHWANPWTWFGHPLRRGTAQMLAGHVFADVILPGLSCRLTVRAENLLAGGQAPLPPTADASANLRAARASLSRQLRALIELEASLATYQQIAKPFSGAATQEDLNRFARLVSFAYGLPVSLIERDEKDGLLAAALTWAATDARPNLPANLAEVYAEQLQQMETRLRDALVAEAGAGQQLLVELGNGRGDAATQTSELVWWLNWARDSWLGQTSANAPGNLCGQLRSDLGQQIRQLVLTDASSPSFGAAGKAATASPYSALLDDTARIFSTQGCDAPIYARLDALSVPPYDPLIVRERGERIFNPAFANEVEGLIALAQLPFMQVAHRREPFVCDSSATGWNADALGDASSYIGQYRAFRQRFSPASTSASASASASSPGARPLYTQIAARQLENALNHALNQAQRPKPQAANVWPTQSDAGALSPAPFDEQALAQTSRDLAGSLGTLVAVERSYDEFGFSGGFAAVSGCLQQFAANRLSAIGSLAVQSQLYRPQTSGIGPEFFDLGTVAVTRDYLSRQVARSQVFASYAAPFVTLAENSGSARGNGSGSQTAAYWGNSIAEVNRYVPANDPASEMGQLAALFVDRLNGMTAQNCGARLQNLASTPGDGADNLFASVRRSLVSDTEMRCQGSDADAFTQLFALFDASLAGRYPFGQTGAPEASLLAVREFFTSYAQQSAALRAKLAMLPKSQQQAVRGFLDRLDDIQKFFAATMRPDGALAVRLLPIFNARPGAERGAEQVVKWQMSAAGQSAGYPNGASAIDWVAGQPLQLDVTWADLSHFTPYAVQDLPDAPTVEGRTATFSAGGDWALVRLVQSHAADRGPSPADGIMLRFTVPIATSVGAPGNAAAAKSGPPGPRPAPVGTAQLMVNLRMEGTDAASHSAMPLKLPAFPASTPVLRPTQHPIAHASAEAVQIPTVPPLPPLPTLPAAVDAQTAGASAAN